MDNETYSTTIDNARSRNQESSPLCLLRHPPQCRDLSIRTAAQEEHHSCSTVLPTRYSSVPMISRKDNDVPCPGSLSAFCLISTVAQGMDASTSSNPFHPLIG